MAGNELWKKCSMEYTRNNVWVKSLSDDGKFKLCVDDFDGDYAAIVYLPHPYLVSLHKTREEAQQASENYARKVVREIASKLGMKIEQESDHE